jgi:hypothetical protein
MKSVLARKKLICIFFVLSFFLNAMAMESVDTCEASCSSSSSSSILPRDTQANLLSDLCQSMACMNAQIKKMYFKILHPQNPGIIDIKSRWIGEDAKCINLCQTLSSLYFEMEEGFCRLNHLLELARSSKTSNQNIIQNVCELTYTFNEIRKCEKIIENKYLKLVALRVEAVVKGFVRKSSVADREFFNIIQDWISLKKYNECVINLFNEHFEGYIQPVQFCDCSRIFKIQPFDYHIPFSTILNQKAFLVAFFNGNGDAKYRLMILLAQNLIENSHTCQMSCLATAAKKSDDEKKDTCTSTQPNSDDSNFDDSGVEIMTFLPLNSKELAALKRAQKKQRQKERKYEQKKLEPVVEKVKTTNECINEAFVHCDCLQRLNVKLLEKITKIKNDCIAHGGGELQAIKSIERAHSNFYQKLCAFSKKREVYKSGREHDNFKKQLGLLIVSILDFVEQANVIEQLDTKYSCDLSDSLGEIFNHGIKMNNEILKFVDNLRSNEYKQRFIQQFVKNSEFDLKMESGTEPFGSCRVS